MTVQFVSRSTWYAGTPTNNDGSPRPKLAPLRPEMTRHYTGAPTSTKASTWTAQQWMPLLQSIAVSRTKPASFEYNYVIPPRADGSSQIWEYAGTWQAAHSAGENDVSIGVLFAIGVNNHPSYSNYDPTRPTQWEPLTDPMVEAYRYLRDEVLIRQGIVIPAVEEIDHKNMPGAATACPGVSVVDRHADLSKPWAPPVPPPVPPEDDVKPFLWRPAGFQNVFIICGADAMHASPATCAEYGLDPSAPVVDPHPQTLKSVLAKAGMTTADLVK